MAKAISDGKHPINLTVLRNGETIQLNSIYPDEQGLIGIGLTSKQTMIKTDNPIKIVKNSNLSSYSFR